jgi:2-dehydro-3-deoxygluconokinase
MTTEAFELVTFGETMGVLGTDELGPLRNGHRMVLGIAGAESNVAIGVRRIGHSVAWAGRVGADSIGRLIIRELRAEGVDVSHATTDPDAPTGFMLKVRRTTATSEVIYSRKGSAGSRLNRADLATDLIAAARVLHITGITMALSESARDCVLAAVDVARSHDVPVSLDINHRNALWTDDAARSALLDVAPRCDFIFASDHEAALLVGALSPTDAAKAMADLGPRHAIVKRGELGYVAWVDGQLHSGEALTVPVADPVGAGDAFVAGYLASWLEGATPTAALRTANCAGAFAVAVSGDWEGLPTRAELAAFGAGGDPVTR